MKMLYMAVVGICLTSLKSKVLRFMKIPNKGFFDGQIYDAFSLIAGSVSGVLLVTSRLPLELLQVRE